MMLYPKLRQWLNVVAATPLHPQWLLGRKRLPLYRWLASFIRGGRTLDIGCGNGLLRHLLIADTEYVGLDYPATTSLGYRGRPDILGDAQTLPFSNACFDAVAALDVLEHLRRPDEALAEIARVTRSGGIIVIQTPFMYPIHDSPHDYQRWTESGLRYFSERHSMVLEQIQPHSSSIETAVLLGNLAISRSILAAVEKRQAVLLLAPLLLLFVPLANIVGYGLSLVLRESSFMPTGYTAIFRKQ